MFETPYRGFHSAPTRPQLTCQLSPNCHCNFMKCDQSWCTSWGQRHECPITALFFERQTLPIYFPFRATSVNNASTTSTITSGSTFNNDSTTAATPTKTKTGTQCVLRPWYVFLSSLMCSMLTYTQGGFSSTFFLLY